MFDFIPIQYYSNIYYHVMFLISVGILLYSLSYDVKDVVSLNIIQTLGFGFLIVFTLYIGLRPVSTFFGDMGSYNSAFVKIQKGIPIVIKSDYAFNYFLLACTKIMSSQSFFLLVDILYILPCYWFSRLYFKRYWFFAIFMFAGSFSFWSYGTNGIRNGLATAFFITGLCFYERKKIFMYVFFLLSFFIHSSLIIPIAAFITSGIYKNPRLYLYIWLASIPLSLVGGSFWESFFGSIGFEDRTSGYLTGGEEFKEQFSQTGFRWDFVLYSASGIFAGYYYIFKRKINDNFYTHLFGIYAIANAFWILVIRANFSNRFAYLSWFLMAAVIAYPMFRYRIWNDHNKVFGWIVFLYYLFTYIMFLKS